MVLLKRAPPQAAEVAVRPAGPQDRLEVGFRGGAADQRTAQVADFLREAGLARQITVKGGFGRCVHRIADAQQRIDLTVRHEHRVGVARHHVTTFPLVLNPPGIVPLARRQAVHAGNHRPVWVGGADGVGDQGRPGVGRLRGWAMAHDVAFVAQAPRDDGGKRFEMIHEGRHEPDLPFQRQRVGVRVESLQWFRLELPPAHPAGQQHHRQLDIIRFREVAQCLEAPDHHRIQARPADQVRARRLFRKTNLPRPAELAIQHAQRLKVRPQRKDPQGSQAVPGQQGQIRFDHPRVPTLPHETARI